MSRALRVSALVLAALAALAAADEAKPKELKSFTTTPRGGKNYCGQCAVACVVRGLGLKPHLTDQELVDRLYACFPPDNDVAFTDLAGEKRVLANFGTSPGRVLAALEANDLDAEDLGPELHEKWTCVEGDWKAGASWEHEKNKELWPKFLEKVKAELGEGHPVIACVDYGVIAKRADKIGVDPSRLHWVVIYRIAKGKVSICQGLPAYTNEEIDETVLFRAWECKVLLRFERLVPGLQKQYGLRALAARPEKK